MGAWRSKAASLAGRSRNKAEPLLVRALGQTDGHRRTVGLFEYELHPEARYGWGKPPHQGILKLLAAGEPGYEAVVDKLLAYGDDVRRIPGGRAAGDELTWDNDYWAGVDAIAQYAFLAERRPAVYLEVGSGYSTKFARRAIADHGLPTRIVSVDPHPRAEIDALCDRVIRSPLETTDLSVFSDLVPGDVFVLDGSHTSFMNSDAVVAFLDIIPLIPAGVLVCIDDIFLPWDYHPTWAGRWYGEQYLLATFLLVGGGGWTPVFPAWYLTQESPLRERFDPLWEHVSCRGGRYAKSFWMERTNP